METNLEKLKNEPPDAAAKTEAGQESQTAGSQAPVLPTSETKRKLEEEGLRKKLLLSAKKRAVAAAEAVTPPPVAAAPAQDGGTTAATTNPSS